MCFFINLSTSPSSANRARAAIRVPFFRTPQLDRVDSTRAHATTRGPRSIRRSAAAAAGQAPWDLHLPRHVGMRAGEVVEAHLFSTHTEP
jgi:hypothetical protein